MPPVGFEPTIPAGERPQTYALDRAATGTGRPKHVVENNTINCCALTGLAVMLIEYRIGKHVEVAAANFKATTPHMPGETKKHREEPH